EFTKTTMPLVVAGAGPGTGVVVSQGATPPINCSIVAGVANSVGCAGSYSRTSTVALLATPAAGDVFVGWSGACAGVGLCTVDMQQPRAVTATFTKTAFALSVNAAGSGNGTITSQLGLSPAVACTVTGGATT